VLDVVIKALQDPDDSITVPVSVRIKEGEIDNIGSAAVGALGSVFGTAVMSAPVKLAAPVTNLLPFGKKGQTPVEPVELSFSPGDTGLSASDRQALDRLIALMQKEKDVQLQFRHELGTADVERAERLANPDIAECENLAYRLRNRKLELLASRAAVAGQVRGVIASGLPGSASNDAVSQLRSLDRDIADTEDSLDKVYELMRPGAQRQAGRRTRAASIALAEDRMNLIKAYVYGSRIPNVATRTTFTNATSSTADEPQPNGRVTITTVAKKRQ
jgi:hypothetical protein